MRLRTGLRDFFRARFQLLKPVNNRACQRRLPFPPDEPPGGSLNRHEPVRGGRVTYFFLKMLLGIMPWTPSVPSTS